MLLLVSKILVAWCITLVSAIGVWLPAFFVSRSHDELLAGAGALAHGKKAPFVALSATTSWWLSLTNCASAGMLLAMALLHFFPESFEADASGVPPAPASICFWMLIGVLVPALLERMMKGDGSHSHGIPNGSDGNHLHGEKGSRSSGEVLSTATLLIVLMCFHGVSEGLLLGLEEKVVALWSSALPLFLHRFCDGLVIGVAVVKETVNQSADSPGLLATETEGDLVERGSRSSMRFWRCVCHGRVVVWLMLTPITMVCVVLFALATKSSAKLPVDSSIPTQLPTVPQSSSTSVSPSAVVQAVGSGSFVFIGLGILKSERVKGISASAALLAGVAVTGSLFFFSNGAH
ncbi:hypothetical protein ABL78_4066 [Leptomonas seymouri]|uniref:Uncharacterized protein n=1 Tax=Leptomonas seymouri TaxID=5684 RepID=A0A0N0P5U6_LEPSE|nr:hypothetical protein ABL78_4066 [Leptomonas seymouri]|eukprot:KPI86876.1 hypothetical protein ABL78_4066 [Leptomonas seymouri]